ncbi:hypothetical protein FOQG_18690 [Fusarium oxysporum f. sp. raphani 54005]|uniref:Uncharacterized protein n=1 Tax=Fusarium oxysporum f. sp. raphani 54005 TaxID=1089458 RepID=X0B355_FUSOX|nr:hypothetical protein FOQG_18690 [Fusarium oxysporum f. sp. raphani 54005]
MGRRRAFRNPSKVESERERARNRRCRQRQRHQSLVRQEGSAYPGIRVINSVHGQVPPEDASYAHWYCNYFASVPDSTSITAVDSIVERRGLLNSLGQDKLMTDGDDRQSVTRRELTTGRNFGHKVATVRQNLDLGQEEA